MCLLVLNLKKTWFYKTIGQVGNYWSYKVIISLIWYLAYTFVLMTFVGI